MRPETACDLLGQLVYKPSIICPHGCEKEVTSRWQIEGADHSNRFEGAIKLTIHYPAWQTNREAAPEYNEVISTYASEPLLIGECDETALYRKVLDQILKIEAHEAREMLRVMPTLWAPFHPHHKDGMEKWGDIEGDLKFGIA